MGVVFTPSLTTYTTSGKVIHTLFYALIAKVIIGAKGIELIRGNLTEICDEIGHLLDTSPKFIAQGEHTERRMMAIGAQDILTLFMEELHQNRVFRIEVAPEG